MPFPTCPSCTSNNEANRMTKRIRRKKKATAILVFHVDSTSDSTQLYSAFDPS